MTVEEIAAALGLNDPLIQRVAVKHRYRDRPEVEGRRVGKTTETILQALSWLSVNDRQILILGMDGRQATEMGRQAQQWASQLGLDASKIRSAAPTEKAYRGLRGGQIHVDPDAWDRMEPSDVSMLRWAINLR